MIAILLQIFLLGASIEQIEARHSDRITERTESEITLNKPHYTTVLSIEADRVAEVRIIPHKEETVHYLQSRFEVWGTEVAFHRYIVHARDSFVFVSLHYTEQPYFVLR